MTTREEIEALRKRWEISQTVLSEEWPYQVFKDALALSERLAGQPEQPPCAVVIGYRRIGGTGSRPEMEVSFCQKNEGHDGPHTGYPQTEQPPAGGVPLLTAEMAARWLKLDDEIADSEFGNALAAIASGSARVVAGEDGAREKAERRLANFIACIPPKVEGYKMTDALAAKSLFALQDLVERTFKADAALKQEQRNG